MIKRVSFLLSILFFASLLSCQTSTISMNKGEMKKLKTIAIMKFEKAPGITRDVAIECEEAFRGHFINAGYSVLERDKLAAIMGEIEKSQTGMMDNQMEIGRLSGAQALLFGKVTQNKEERKRVSYTEYHKKPRKNVIKEKDMKFYTFQVHVRLVSTATGSTIMTLQNKYPEKDYEITTTITLPKFRQNVLSQMGDDIKDALKE